MAETGKIWKGDNFATTPTVTKYLNYAGLSTFWDKIKTYVDLNDDALKTAVQTKINANDAAIRNYVESLSVNGVDVVTNAKEGVLGTELTVTIDGSHIEAGAAAGKYAGNVGETTNKYTVDAAFGDVDARLNAAEKTLGENVVNVVEVVDTPAAKDAEGQDTDTPDYVKFTKSTTGSAAEGNFTVTLTVDETALDEKIVEIDEKIIDLEANAGVVGINFSDTPADGGDYVKLSMESKKYKETTDETVAVGGTTYYKSLVTVTVDETALDEKFESVDAIVEAEIADRKEDTKLLGGDGFTPANGETAASWSGDVKWNNITAIDEYLKANEANLTALGDKVTDSKHELQVNGHTVITVTEGDQVSVSGSSIDLVTADIKHNWSEGDTITNTDLQDKALSEILDDHESRIDALSSATHFIGITEETLSDGLEWTKTSITIVGEASAHTLENGDVVIAKNSEGDEGVSREYIYHIIDGAETGTWYELGDTTQEAARLTKVENWIDNNIISESEINDLFTEANAAARDFTFA